MAESQRRILFMGQQVFVKVVRIVKAAAALLLLVAFTLPLSRCSNETPPTGGASATESVRTSVTYQYNYAWSDFDPKSAFSWLAMVVFFWPLPFILSEAFRKGKSGKAWLLVVQMLFAAASILEIYRVTFLDELWYGGYLAYSALGLYFLTAATELFMIVGEKVREARSSGHG